MPLKLQTHDYYAVVIINEKKRGRNPQEKDEQIATAWEKTTREIRLYYYYYYY